jgi:hypothetical protein
LLAWMCSCQCCWGWVCSGMWRCVIQWVVPHILKDCNPLLMVQHDISEVFEPSTFIYCCCL